MSHFVHYGLRMCRKNRRIERASTQQIVILNLELIPKQIVMLKFSIPRYKHNKRLVPSTRSTLLFSKICLIS